jgi:hypothetical protein
MEGRFHALGKQKLEMGITEGRIHAPGRYCLASSCGGRKMAWMSSHGCAFRPSVI